MQSFPIGIAGGVAHRIESTAKGDQNEVEPINGTYSYTIDNGAIASISPNAGSGSLNQVDCAPLAAGSAVVTASTQNAAGATITSQFQLVVTAPPPPQATHIDFADLGPLA